MFKRPRIAFVAAGGYHRAAAHLGVLQALEKLSLGVDLVIGSSAGALIAAGLGQGWGVERLKRFLLSAPELRGICGVSGALRFREGGRKRAGLLSTERLEQKLRALFSYNDFASLPRETYVVAADIDQGEPVVFGPGEREEVLLSEAVASACALPGLFRPRRVGGSYLMDAAVLGGVFVSVALSQGADVILVSLPAGAVPKRGEGSFGKRSARQILFRAIDLAFAEATWQAISRARVQAPEVEIILASTEISLLHSGSGFDALMAEGYAQGLRALSRAGGRILGRAAYDPAHVNTV